MLEESSSLGPVPPSYFHERLHPQSVTRAIALQASAPAALARILLHLPGSTGHERRLPLMRAGMSSFASAWLPWAVLIVAAAATPSGSRAADTGPKRWTDDQLVASYKDLASGGGLEGAVRSPSLPKDPPRPGFLDALAWYAAGTPDRPGALTLET